MSRGQLFSQAMTTQDILLNLPFVARRSPTIDLLSDNNPLQWLYWIVQPTGDRLADNQLGRWYGQLAVAASPRWGQILRAGGADTEDSEMLARVIAGAIETAHAGYGSGIEEGLFKQVGNAVFRGSLN